MLFILRGWVFSVPLMAILLVHEMGHYTAGRFHRMDVTPPYFIPAIPPVGTFGAFIRIKSPIVDRNALMDVGAAGPLAGTVVAIPCLIVGLWLSHMEPRAAEPGVFSLGSSLLVEGLLYLRFGTAGDDITVILHPTAIAAWFGLFVTAMNLLPMGQLDGGHVIYALFGDRWARLISVGFFAMLIPLGIILWTGWLVFGLLVFFLGLRHPPPVDPYRQLDPRRRIVGWAAIVLFVLAFVPVPVSIVE